MPFALSVNINKIALLRNSREGDYPSPLFFGRLCLEAGANGLTVHPRPDQRHIRPQDVFDAAALAAEFPHREFNIEGNPFAAPLNDYPGLMALVERTRPAQCTLVPDTHSQLTSDHGFNLTKDGAALAPIIQQLKAWGVRVSLFMDPNPAEIERAAQLGADRIELYTGPYASAHAHGSEQLDTLFNTYCQAAAHAKSLGLGVNAGHDLNLANLPRFHHMPGLLEVSIGHALTVDALLMGYTPAVKAYLAICHGH